MKLYYIPRQDARGFLRAMKELWQLRLGRKVSLIEIVHLAVEELMEKYQWRPNMGKRVRSLSDMAKQYGLDPGQNKLEYYPVNCGNCGKLIPLRLVTSHQKHSVNSADGRPQVSPVAIAGDPRCPGCGHAWHPEN